MTMYFVNTKLKAKTSPTRRRTQLRTPSTRSSQSSATTTTRTTTTKAAAILKQSCYSLVIFGLVLATCLSCCQCSGHLPDSHQHHTHKQHRQITSPAFAASHQTSRQGSGGETKLINYDTKAGANSSVESGDEPQVAADEAPGDVGQKPGGPGSKANGDRPQQQQQQPVKRPEETLHKLMSEKDLRRTFQVETHDQVPEYQVLKLIVSSDGSHLISPISDLGELLITSNTKNQRRHHYAGSQGDAGGQQQVAGADEARDESGRNSSNNGNTRNHINKETSAEEAHTNEDGHWRPQADASSRIKRAAATTSAADSDGRAKAALNDEDQRLIVMNLSTFGQDFSLRLKRNADFQQRIKDMKMFLAESTGDGQLRYTEIQQAQQHRKQEPHKRAADSSEDSRQQQQQVPPESAAATNTSGGASNKDKTTTTANSDWHNIGSTYHDETNLAALLIERDRQTGRIQVDGTIGNEFVIKPMPHGALEALRAKHSSSSARGAPESDAAAAASKPELNAIGLERLHAASSGNELRQAAAHMHDDDPHDDDEMFLDEDEALELAAGQSGAGSSQAAPSTGGQQQQQQVPRVLGKAASERKLRKHRKLMQAQTLVPKLSSPETTSAAESLASASTQRAQRHAAKSRTTTTVAAAVGANGNTDQDVHSKQPEHFHMSHHIIYKQKPSSEASSSEHQHSFMFAPGQRDMEQLVAGVGGGGGLHLARVGQATDYAHDPLGGQFYLEPGSVTGFERAGHSDWSFSTRGRGRAFPALNGTAPGLANVTSEEAWLASDQPTAHARFKRHLGASGGQSRLRPAGSHQQRRLVASRPQQEPGASRRRHKRQAPDVVWPEVLLVVDYDSFLLHGGDSREVKRYFVSFWNGVDLRYKLLVNPHIRISLAGMIVAKDRDATPYLERNRLRAPNADAVDAAGALTDMGKYLYREDRLPTYDLAVVITKLDMCRRRFEGGRCNRGTAGFAYVGGACVVNKRLEKVNSVAIIEDSGGFSGIIVAAHEVGHLLGCVHDGSPPPSYLGGPGATHCPWEDGFIMSDLRHTERGFRWSSCSVEQFKHFLNGETATCLYNYPHESQMLHRLLPGSMLSLDDQCKRDRGTNACFKDQRVCAQLFCFDSASGYCVSYRPAAEGSPCGDGMVCRNGKCVGEIENIIPDYTHQSQTVVAATGARQRALAAGLPVPAAATASVSSALVPAGRLTDALSTSSSSTSAALEGAASKSLAPTSATTSASSSSSGAKPSERRMDTFQVDTPTLGNRFQTTDSNYLAGGNYQQQQRQTPLAYNNNNQNHQFQTTEHSNLNHKQQQQQARYQKLTTASNNLNTNHAYNGNNNNRVQQQQNRRRDQTSAITRPSEMLHVAASSSSGQSSGQFGTTKRVAMQQHVNFVGGSPLNQPSRRTSRTQMLD